LIVNTESFKYVFHLSVEMEIKNPYQRFLYENNINEIIMGFDIDGCMVPLTEYNVGLINDLFYFNKYPNIAEKLFESPVTIEDMINFDYSKSLNIEDDERDKIFDLLQDNKLLEEIGIYPYAADVMNTINSVCKKTNKIVTSRGNYYSNAKEQTTKFLDMHKVNYKNNLIFDSDKPKVSGKYNINTFVEDRLKTVIELADAGIFVFMPDHYHNNIKTEICRELEIDKEKLERFKYVQNHKNVLRVDEPYWINMAITFSEASDIFRLLKKYELLKAYILLNQKNGRNQKVQ